LPQPLLPGAENRNRNRTSFAVRAWRTDRSPTCGASSWTQFDCSTSAALCRWLTASLRVAPLWPASAS